MKILYLSVAFLLGLTTTSLAQDSPKTLSPEAQEQCIQLTKLMAKHLYLYDSDYLKLKSLNEKTMQKVQELYALYKDSPSMQQARLKEVTAEFEAEVKKMLVPQQVVALESYKLDASMWLNTPEAIKIFSSTPENE